MPQYSEIAIVSINGDSYDQLDSVATFFTLNTADDIIWKEINLN